MIQGGRMMVKIGARTNPLSQTDNPEADPDDPLAQPSSSIEMSDVGEEAPSSTPGSSGISG